VHLSRRRRLATLLAVALAACGLSVVASVGVGGAPSAAAASASGVVQHAMRVAVGPEPDGTAVSLDVSVFTPPGDSGAGPTRYPAIILAHGFGGTKADLAGQARTLAAADYVVLTYTARGFGASGGRIHLDAPVYEVADVSHLVDTLAARRDVELDGPGDPRVGIAGGSYGGGLALLAAAHDHRIDAVLSALAWNDLATALFPQGVQSAPTGAAAGTPAAGTPAAGTPAAGSPIATTGVFKQRWTSLLFSSGAGSSSATPAASGSPGSALNTALCGRFDPTLCRLYLQTAQTGVVSPQLTALLDASSPAPVLGRIRAPTLLVQGEQDSLFGLDQADANARGIAAAGTTVAVDWIAGGHDSLAGATTDLSTLGLAWFAHELKRQPATAATPSGWTFAAPVTGSAALASAAAAAQGGPNSQNGSGGAGSAAALAAQPVTEALHLAAYPGLDGAPAIPRRTIALHGVGGSGAAQSILSPPGGVPAAITSLAGDSPGLDVLDSAGLGGSLGVLAGQSAVFSSAPSTTSLRITGVPTAQISVTSSTTDATLFAGLWLEAPDGTQTLPNSLVSPLQLTGLTPGVARTVTVALPGVVAEVPTGDRLQLVVSATDQGYAVPRDARGYQIALAGGVAAGVSVPVAAGAVAVAAAPATVPIALLVAAVAVVLMALVIALLTRRRRRRAPAAVAVETAAVPLVVDGLSKTYGDRAVVTDVSWQALPGQVVGLLGPNGAGKTTTMRMLVGLIRPDAGSVRVFGETVVPGTPVLSRIGAFIEGPGFLPHLSGRQNLDAFWAATGRPTEAAHLDEALEIAGLHGAVDRRVRGYSQGMRQRLGVAQAMLGLPDVLILDEPTNGLDPPQIQRMRSVLTDYAATGRTVIVSSHLISEVEQSCSHVVVMRAGAVVLTGSVAELISTGSTVAVDVDDVQRAATVLRDSAGIGAVDVAGPTRVVAELAGARRDEVVSRLVGGGLAVTSVSSTARLEDIVLQAIGDGGVQ
jgi:ABC-2 type transport system ATP-binding protein